MKKIIYVLLLSLIPSLPLIASAKSSVVPFKIAYCEEVTNQLFHTNAHRSVTFVLTQNNSVGVAYSIKMSGYDFAQKAFMDQMRNGVYRLRATHYDFTFDVDADAASAVSADTHDFFDLSCQYR
ncbi:MAG: hypothetical protein ACXVBK_17350 [Flavisolibacter sp.]